MRGNRQIADTTVTAETRIYLIVLVGLVAFCSSCKKNKQRDDAVKIVKEWTGKEIKFSDFQKNNYGIL